MYYDLEDYELHFKQQVNTLKTANEDLKTQVYELELELEKARDMWDEYSRTCIELDWQIENTKDHLNNKTDECIERDSTIVDLRNQLTRCRKDYDTLLDDHHTLLDETNMEEEDYDTLLDDHHTLLDETNMEEEDSESELRLELSNKQTAYDLLSNNYHDLMLDVIHMRAKIEKLKKTNEGLIMDNSRLINTLHRYPYPPSP